MTTNREWLYSLDVADLSDWFDAEHVDDNGTFSAENDVSAGAVDANDANVAQDSSNCETCEELQNHRELIDRALEGWQKALVQRNELADELTSCKQDRELYRELLSKTITLADEIVNLQP